ncbi:TetR/AcrR family transcriptional regulator [Streptosporangium sandarakinum]|uniref:AcrR family transcriptional regulator n=1 Tax=Streptosporangium sandarakinum TaxID=1260955 RepID=A0A852V0V7_9ACTN|nr:TetR/AcrR family transcriptional regulator [Streptosporangium sandarakinum]NYF43402.1 AcrR family transcriptional regulator [Streptosporangium sandarakinum]
MARGFGRLRRDDLLRAACGVIAARGFGHTRTADIARAAGVSQALLFYHFETREKMLAQALAYAAERDLAALERMEASGGSPPERLRALLALYSPGGRPTSWTLWIDARAESVRDADLEAICRETGLRWRRALRSVVDEGVGTGAFDCADPDGAVWRIIALVDGLAAQVTAHRRLLTRARLAELVRASAELELGLPRGALC